MIKRPFLMLLSALILLGGIGLLGAHSLARAYVLPEPAATSADILAFHSSSDLMLAMLQSQEPTGHPPSDAACISCHSDTDAVLTFPSGEELPVVVDPAVVAASAHGTLPEPPLACTSCHQAASYQYPHAAVDASDARAYEIERSAACESCHVQPHLTSHPGPESDNPVVCTDCHGSHEVLTVVQLQAGEGTDACVACHTEREVTPADPAVLNELIQSGLFQQQQVNNDYCLACHSQPGLTMTLPNGDVLNLTIDDQALHDSVHGADNPWQPLACTDCHEIDGYPHPPVTAQSEREYTLNRYQSCERCHEQQYQANQDSVHSAALEEGNLDAAVCTDCHGAHDTAVPNVPRARISHTCEQCHIEIYNEYAESVHGAALLEEDNPDVPTCIDCHGVHNIGDPTTDLFRIRSPQLCAECHADVELMAKYEISTNVFDSYVADFHGTTVMLFDPEDPTAETNKAVCYDCHGVHNIKSPDDPDAGIKNNLVATCQKCHPDAQPNFSDAWTSHFEPSLTNNTLMFLVNLFYDIVIPLTVGFFAFLVATDIYRRVRFRLRPQTEK